MNKVMNRVINQTSVIDLILEFVDLDRGAGVEVGPGGKVLDEVGARGDCLIEAGEVGVLG